MPLSVQGLCEAEMTTPASNLRQRARWAIARSGDHAGALDLHALRGQAGGNRIGDGQAGFARVLSDHHAAARSPRQMRASARPMAKVVSRSRGNAPATPRIPSVPNSFLSVFIIAKVKSNRRDAENARAEQKINNPRRTRRLGGDQLSFNVQQRQGAVERLSQSFVVLYGLVHCLALPAADPMTTSRGSAPA